MNFTHNGYKFEGRQSEAEEFLSKDTFYKMNKDDEGFPLCTAWHHAYLNKTVYDNTHG